MVSHAAVMHWAAFALRMTPLGSRPAATASISSNSRLAHHGEELPISHRY